ncbi:stimulated by retinoic acid gene 8 protein homolog isoform X2 [Brachyhypopomus gauderio]|uniref:stimulated by retinoic acid gene 8 protein homolog isoform X2 n=1 Tax=Brachyhypopomus gauderio TaxID=698409 RepID=UPI004043511D
MFSGRGKKKGLTKHRKRRRRAGQARHRETLTGQALHRETLTGQALHRETLTGQALHRETLTGQALHRETLAGLFESLKTVVCPSTQRTPAKWKILDHAKGFLLEKEAYLSKLLAAKDIFLNDNEGPKTLEDVREEYRKLYSKCFFKAYVPDVDEGSDDSEEDPENEEVNASPQSDSSVPNLQEFESYLCFYRRTLELLLYRGVLAPYQTGLPVVSQAISGLWNILPPEQRTAVQRHTQDKGSVSGAKPAGEPPFNPLDLSQLIGSNAPGTSAFETDLLQDACDVVQRDMDATTANRAALQPLRHEDYHRLREICKDIEGFVRSHTSQDEEPSQDCYLSADSEELFLMCSESFDEDF